MEVKHILLLMYNLSGTIPIRYNVVLQGAPFI